MAFALAGIGTVTTTTIALPAFGPTPVGPGPVVLVDGLFCTDNGFGVAPLTLAIFPIGTSGVLSVTTSGSNVRWQFAPDGLTSTWAIPTTSPISSSEMGIAAYWVSGRTFVNQLPTPTVFGGT